MENKGTILLETQNLILNKFEEKDYLNIFDNYASNKNVTKYLTWEAHKNILVTKKILKTWLESYENLDFYHWAINLKFFDKNPIGSISVVNLNKDLKIAEIGYCIGENWWNKKITTEALNEVIKYLFEKVKLNKIEAKHNIKNKYSGYVMKKCNMEFEKVLIQNNDKFNCYYITYEQYKNNVN